MRFKETAKMILVVIIQAPVSGFDLGFYLILQYLAMRFL